MFWWSKTDLAVIQALTESIENSNKASELSSSYALSLQDKLSNPGTHEKAKYWFPKTEKVANISKSAFDFIEAAASRPGK